MVGRPRVHPCGIPRVADSWPPIRRCCGPVRPCASAGLWRVFGVARSIRATGLDPAGRARLLHWPAELEPHRWPSVVGLRPCGTRDVGMAWAASFIRRPCTLRDLVSVWRPERDCDAYDGGAIACIKGFVRQAQGVREADPSRCLTMQSTATLIQRSYARRSVRVIAGVMALDRDSRPCFAS